MIGIDPYLKNLHEHNQFSNAKYYYINKNGNDANDGLNPDDAKLTINATLPLLSEGDYIIVGPGIYVENIDLNVDFMHFVCEAGVTVAGTVTISGDVVTYDGCRAAPASGNAYNITGDVAIILGASAVAGVVGFNITGFFCILDRCVAVGYTQTGYNISGFNNILVKPIAQGAGNVRGFYLSSPSAQSSLFDSAVSNGNILAGYECVIGAINNIFADCISGSGDGKKIDENSTNMWVNFKDELPQQHNEFLYPPISGEGISQPPITVDNLATNDAGGTRTDRWYYGDTIRIIPKNAITEEYKFYGININANTANKDIMFQLLFTNGVEASQNGGNDWDQSETILTVDDASKFLVDDWIWITGNDVPDGEIVKITNIATNVITIERDTTASAGTGLRYNYDITPVNNKIYLVHRPSNTVFHKIDDNFSAPSSKSFVAYKLSEVRTISANGACLIRCSNGTDNLTINFEVRAKCET